jgi:hypothetical protein
LDSVNKGINYGELLFTRKSGVGWVYETAFPLGWAILFLMIFIDIFTLPQIRRRKCFEVNYKLKSIIFL